MQKKFLDPQGCIHFNRNEVRPRRQFVAIGVSCRFFGDAYIAAVLSLTSCLWIWFKVSDRKIVSERMK
eukprot:scaffold558399_cov14-Prasinocladus_malaysianus.AAC.1